MINDNLHGIKRRARERSDAEIKALATTAAEALLARALESGTQLDPNAVTLQGDVEGSNTGNVLLASIKPGAVTLTKLASATTAYLLDLANATGTTDNITEGTTNLYFTDQRARVAASAGLSTGILSGGALSINAANPATLDIAAGRGFVVNNTVVPPTVTVVEWESKIGVAITDLATADATDIAINAAGDVVQQRSYTSAEMRRFIFLGGVDHSNNVQIQNIFSIQVPVYAPALSVRDLAAGIGDLNISGNQFTANGATLQVNKSAGMTFSFGRNAAVSSEDPNRISQPAQSPVTFRYVFDNGSGVANFGVERTAIDPNNYDGGAGALVAMGPNRYSIQRFLLFANSNNVLIQYGPNTYNKLEEALQAVAAEGFKNLIGTTTALSRGFLIVKQGTTNLADAANARFLIANRFGALEAAGTPSGVQSIVQGLGIAVDSTDPANPIVKVEDSGWQAPTLQNAWANFGSGFANAGYRKLAGQVILRGVVGGGTMTDGTTLFTLPVGYRPLANQIFASHSISTTARVDVNSDGTVKIYNITNNTYLTLSGISFTID